MQRWLQGQIELLLQLCACSSIKHCGDQCAHGGGVSAYSRGIAAQPQPRSEKLKLAFGSCVESCRGWRRLHADGVLEEPHAAHGGYQRELAVELGGGEGNGRLAAGGGTVAVEARLEQEQHGRAAVGISAASNVVG